MDKKFDGDQMHFSLALDNKMADLWSPLAPHNNIFNIDQINKISDAVRIPKPVIINISKWLSTSYKEIDPIKLTKFNQLF